MSIERTNPITGTEVQRRWLQANAATIEAAEEGASIGAQELHTSVDGAGLERIFRSHKNIGRTYHLGNVADEAEMLALDSPFASHACLPGDTCFRTDTQQTMRCISNYGASLSDWEVVPASGDPSGTAATAVSAHNTATDSHADLREILAGKQAAGSYLTTTGTAADSAMLGGQLPSYYAQASHTHSGYETAIGNPSVSGYLLSSTTAGVRSWVAPYSHPATHAQSVIDSSAGWITTALASKAPLVSPSFTGGVRASSGANHFALAVTTPSQGPWQTVFSRSDLTNCSWKTFLADDGVFRWYNHADSIVPLEMYQSGLIRLGGYGSGVLTTDYQGKISSTQGKTAAVVIGGTTLNFQNGVLMSVSQ